MAAAGAPTPVPVAEARAAFDLGDPDRNTYLNAAGRSALLRSAHTAAIAGVAMKLRPWDFGEADISQAKQLFASHVQCSADDVALVPSAAYAVSTVAANLSLGEDEELLILEDHYASVLPWQHAAERSGARLVALPRGQPAVQSPNTRERGIGRLTRAILERICEHTAVVSAPPCSWTDGELIELGPISAACRRVGAALVVDATQWVGAMPFSVTGDDTDDGNAARPDAVIVSSHKWLLGLYGHAFLYVSPPSKGCSPRLAAMTTTGTPLEFHDRNRVGSEKWDSGDTHFIPTGSATTGSVLGGGGFPAQFVGGAARFDMGGRPNVVLLPALICGLSQTLHGWGPAPRIAATLRPLTRALAHRARELGFRVPGQHADHIIGLYPAPWMGLSAEDLEEALQAESVWVAARWGALRVSPYLYNDMADIERLCMILERLLPVKKCVPPPGPVNKPPPGKELRAAVATAVATSLASKL